MPSDRAGKSHRERWLLTALALLGCAGSGPAAESRPPPPAPGERGAGPPASEALTASWVDGCLWTRESEDAWGGSSYCTGTEIPFDESHLSLPSAAELVGSLGGVALYPTTDPSAVLPDEPRTRSCTEPWLWLSLTAGEGACLRDCPGSRQRFLGFLATLRLVSPSGRTIERPATVVVQESGPLTIASAGPPVVNGLGEWMAARRTLTVVLSSPSASATFVDQSPEQRSADALVRQARGLGVEELLRRLSFESLTCRRSGAELLTEIPGPVRLSLASRASSPCDGGGERVTMVVDGGAELGRAPFDARLARGSFGRHREGMLESASGLTVTGTAVITTDPAASLRQRLGCARAGELSAELELGMELWSGQPATATLALRYRAPACGTGVLQCTGSWLEVAP